MVLREERIRNEARTIRERLEEVREELGPEGLALVAWTFLELAGHEEGIGTPEWEKVVETFGGYGEWTKETADLLIDAADAVETAPPDTMV